jgi:NitT/TauT family transport system permease protein
MTGVAASAEQRAGKGDRIAARLRRAVEPALWFAGLLLIWEVAVRALAVPVFVLPAPSVFLWRIVESAPDLAWHGGITTRLVLYGFVAGAIPGIALGYVSARSRLAHDLIYPLVVFIQGLPKITLAPLMLVWFGFAEGPKVFLTALITFFPVMVDSFTGFRHIDPRLYHLSKSSGASWLKTLWYFELPSAAPHIFSGLRISLVVAVTVVIVVEWLNSKTGLGYLVLRAMDSKDTAMIFAILVVGSMIGVALSGTLAAIENRVVPRKRR